MHLVRSAFRESQPALDDGLVTNLAGLAQTSLPTRCSGILRTYASYSGNTALHGDMGGTRWMSTVDGATYQGLSIPPHPDTLENCIKSWSLQPHKHALVAPPRWLCLHLPRFLTDAGDTRKSDVPISFQAGETAHVPFFVSGTQLRWIPYSLAAAGIMHTGHKPHASHYRSFLTEPHNGGGSRIVHGFRVTDDKSPSKVATPALNSLIPTQCYMCFLILREHGCGVHQP